jgi:uncharacterized membrane protein (DUF373 family)
MNKPVLRSPPISSRPLTRPPTASLDSFDEKLPNVEEDALIKALHAVLHFAARALALLMTFVILFGVADIVVVMHQRLVAPPFLLLTVSDILAIFGSFMVVLIAIEIFINITLYIKRDVLPIKMVIATALMAIARKVIMLDFNDLEPPYIVAIAAVILALGITYWMISYKPRPVHVDER